MTSFWLLLVIISCLASFAMANINLSDILTNNPAFANEAIDLVKNYIRAPNNTRISNRYIIKLNDDIPHDIVNNISTILTESFNATVHHQIRSIFSGFTVTIPNFIPNSLLQKMPFIDFVEEDQYVYSTQLQKLNSNLWGLDSLDGELNNQYSFTLTGKGVNVYILDSGIDASHSEFSGRASSVYIANFLSSGGGYDCTGHGTHVAGIIGGTNVGVAKLTNLLSLRVIGCQDESMNSEIVAAIDWITANHVKPAVINMSLGPKVDENGNYPKSLVLDRAIQNAISTGLTLVVAAGNDNVDCCKGSPGGSPGAIPVAAVDENMQRSSFSNFGACVQYFAPGNNIISAKPSGGYAIKSGTSQASPFVTGIIALILEANPNATPSEIIAQLSQNAVTGIVKNSMTSPNFFAQTFKPDIQNSNQLVQLADPNLISVGSSSSSWQTIITIVSVAAAGIIASLIIAFIISKCCGTRNVRIAKILSKAKLRKPRSPLRTPVNMFVEVVEPPPNLIYREPFLAMKSGNNHRFYLANNQQLSNQHHEVFRISSVPPTGIYKAANQDYMGNPSEKTPHLRRSS